MKGNYIGPKNLWSQSMFNLIEPWLADKLCTASYHRQLSTNNKIKIIGLKLVLIFMIFILISVEAVYNTMR